jgi:hypothetical protein
VIDQNGGQPSTMIPVASGPSTERESDQ